MFVAENKPILITGSHRSGSTWLGKMIALAPEIAYLHEPFNPKSSICENNFDFWFTYINQENEHIYKDCLSECITFNYSVYDRLKQSSSLVDIGRIIRDKFYFLFYRWGEKRPLLKDPISILSASWLYEVFNMDVVVLIRHPAAFVGSLKKANWSFPFNHFIEQPMLMNYCLSDYHDAIYEYSINPPSIIDQGILLWNIIYERILKYKKCYEDEWIFLRHEDLSRKPIPKFKQLYQQLNINLTPKIKNKIIDYSKDNIDNKSKLKRNSQHNIWSWKDRLTKSEIYKIKENTLEISKFFYSDSDW